ncbi:hypothetical protein HK102_001931 [Quaeritorhiza haematococci]|nr:hypothetical protein HK102_001931 [Quaeritorhiza haematococci]
MVASFMSSRDGFKAQTLRLYYVLIALSLSVLFTFICWYDDDDHDNEEDTLLAAWDDAQGENSCMALPYDPYAMWISSFNYCRQLNGAVFRISPELHQTFSPSSSFTKQNETTTNSSAVQSDTGYSCLLASLIDQKAQQLTSKLQNFNTDAPTEELKRLACYVVANGFEFEYNGTDLQLVAATNTIIPDTQSKSSPPYTLVSVDSRKYFPFLSLAPQPPPSRANHTQICTDNAFPPARHKRKARNRRFKLAYLLSVHDSFEKTRVLVNRLVQEPNVLVGIHVDYKSKMLRTQLEEYLSGKVWKSSKVVLLDLSFNVMWGHISIVFAELEGFFRLLDFADWDFIINLSEHDYPLQRSDLIHQRLNSIQLAVSPSPESWIACGFQMDFQNSKLAFFTMVASSRRSTFNILLTLYSLVGTVVLFNRGPIVSALAGGAPPVERISDSKGPNHNGHFIQGEEDHDFEADGRDRIEASWIGALFELSKEEVDTIRRGNGALTAYTMKPQSCFRMAAQELKEGCRKVHVDDYEKTIYAIRLTLCEIATANLSPPVECIKFDEFHDFAWTGKEKRNVPAAKCVEALSRNNILWTSYSGYSREVVNMCFAVRYELEREWLAKLYRNLTSAQLTTYRLLRTQHRGLLAWRNESMRELQNLNLKQREIFETAESIEKTTVQTSARTNLIAETVNDAHGSLKSLLEGWKAEFTGQMDTMSSTTGNLNQALATSFSVTTKSFEAITFAVERLSQNISSIADMGSRTADSLGEMDRFFRELFQSINTQTRQLAEQFDDVSSGLITLGNQLETMSEENLSRHQQLQDVSSKMYEHQLTMFGTVSRILDSINRTAFETFLVQDLVQQNLNNLAHQWEVQFDKAQKDLDKLNNKSTTQIAMLLDAAKTASARHAELLNYRDAPIATESRPFDVG